MNSRLLVTVAVVTVVAVAGTVVGGPGGHVSAAENASNGTPPSGNTSMGAQISSFMGASTAAANGSVENGMFSASFDASASTDRPALIGNRTTALERRLERLRDRKAAVIANRENMTRAAYLARISAIAGQIDSLRASINQTATFAGETGVNATGLDRLRTEARNLTGPEIARLARNGTVGVGNPGRGPPDGVPGKGPGKDDEGNSSDPGKGQGNDGGQGKDNGQGNDKGQGNDDDQGKDGNPGDDNGQGNEGDEGKDDGQGKDDNPGDDNGQGKDGDQGKDNGQGNDGDQGKDGNPGDDNGQGNEGDEGKDDGQGEDNGQGDDNGQGNDDGQGSDDGKGGDGGKDDDDGKGSDGGKNDDNGKGSDNGKGEGGGTGSGPT